eukprot:Protomagalhaensia_wolfi_Nauph_80__4179@NODE_424_length_2545_cov_30_204709_g317_i0_p2_GENE_NODE_424_length_2545_cov_30_204709_g317_i0NODE_424_length_2545_cov_30_204709_g317_i0_p2_ORF_typecomplete_len200_score30_63_NODE_424_length_2545_cov_30_204709_g317_i012281827
MYYTTVMHVEHTFTMPVEKSPPPATPPATPATPLAPGEPIPAIVSHAPSRPARAFPQQDPPVLGTGPHAPHFQGSPRPGEVLPPSPTMFPITVEIYGSEPQPSLQQPIDQEINPTPVGLATTLDQLIKTPIVSPLPTPGVVNEAPRLTEADADLIDIWFFRGALPPSRLEEEVESLRQWKMLRQTDDGTSMPLTPSVPS